jgi:hypothetical protein
VEHKIARARGQELTSLEADALISRDERLTDKEADKLLAALLRWRYEDDDPA